MRGVIFIRFHAKKLQPLEEKKIQKAQRQIRKKSGPNIIYKLIKKLINKILIAG